MIYTYAYKTSDGVRHEAMIEAASRDEVFAALRQQGIKAIKVVAADGSKANGEIRGVRKRVVAAVAVAAALSVGTVAFFAGESNNQTIKQPNNPLSTPRHQIYGDPVIVDEFERGSFDSVLTNRLDQMLAWFAQPGKLMCPKGTDPRRMADEFAAALEVTGTGDKCSTGDEDASGGRGGRRTRQGCRVYVVVSLTDSREVRELKQIVNGLHEELSAYLVNGNGTARSYWRRLLERTQQEMQIYERTRRELERETDPAVWEQKNEALRRLGLRTIPNPKDGE